MKLYNRGHIVRKIMENRIKDRKNSLADETRKWIEKTINKYPFIKDIKYTHQEDTYTFYFKDENILRYKGNYEFR